MEQIIWPLTLLEKAIPYKNLTQAADHIGISQPQLSRIIKKIEDELQVTLLNRSSKKNASWTNEAFKLAQLFSDFSRSFNNQLKNIVNNQLPDEIKIGSLEGLSSYASSFSNNLYQSNNTKSIHLNIYDLDQLEQKLNSNEVDLIFTVSSKKNIHERFHHLLGYQNLRYMKKNNDLEILSEFEFDKLKMKKKNLKYFVSNSLFVREQCFESIGGQGYFPQSLHKNSKSQDHGVYVIGSENLSNWQWDQYVTLLKNI